MSIEEMMKYPCVCVCVRVFSVFMGIGHELNSFNPLEPADIPEMAVFEVRLYSPSIPRPKTPSIDN